MFPSYLSHMRGNIFIKFRTVLNPVTRNSELWENIQVFSMMEPQWAANLKPTAQAASGR